MQPETQTARRASAGIYGVRMWYAIAARWHRVIDTWLDGVESGWSIGVLLAGFVLVWTIILTIAYQGADLHPDALEAWSIGQIPAWGYAKHPPVMGWIAALWFGVFPLSDWAFQLLAMTNAAVGLWAVDLISRRFASGNKRIVILLLLMLLPTYHFHAQRFNANAVLVSLWPIAAYCFLRSFETRAALWALLAGLAAALAMLGKYYSIFLLGGFVVAAALHPGRRAYFLSLAPWLSAASGTAFLAPHIHWLATHNYAPFTYATSLHTGFGLLESVNEAGKFLLGNLYTIALPALAWTIMIRPHTRRCLADLAAIRDGRLLLLLIFLASTGLAAAVTIGLRTSMPALWNWQGLFLLIVPTVSAATFPIGRSRVYRLMTSVAAIFAVIAASAPLHAIYRNAYGYSERRNSYRGAAEELTQRWHGLTASPIFAVSGDDRLALAVTFYSGDHPLYGRLLPGEEGWKYPDASILTRGWVALCFEDDAYCTHWMNEVEQLNGPMIRQEITVRSHLWIWPGTTARIIALMALPRGAS